MYDRDPRQNPVAGDVTVSLNGTRYRVVEVDSVKQRVSYFTTLVSRVQTCPLADWRNWSKSDVVAELAENAGTSWRHDTFYGVRTQ